MARVVTRSIARQVMAAITAGCGGLMFMVAWQTLGSTIRNIPSSGGWQTPGWDGFETIGAMMAGFFALLAAIAWIVSYYMFTQRAVEA